MYYDTSDGRRIKNFTAGPAQRSIVGTDLWYVTYNGVFHVKLSPEAYLIGYADDIAMVIIPTEVDMRVETDAIATTNAVKYLRLCFDCKMTFWEQFRTTCGKVAKKISSAC